jgi:chromosome segregation ATPase
MAVMKKDVNFVFFILIIATVVSFAGFTAYYQVSFRNINEEYNTKLAELNKVTQDLLDKKSLLLQTSVELNTTKQGREELGEQYDKVKGERDSLQSEADTLKENLFQTRAELEQKKTQVNTLSTQLRDAQDEAENWKADYLSCDEKRDAYQSCEDELSSDCSDVLQGCLDSK